MRFEHTPIEKLKCNSANLKTIILDCERLRKPVTFFTRTRNYIGDFKAIDHDNKPITLDRFVLHGGLVYFKGTQFEWKTISLDDVTAIEY